MKDVLLAMLLYIHFVYSKALTVTKSVRKKRTGGSLSMPPGPQKKSYLPNLEKGKIALLQCAVQVHNR